MMHPNLISTKASDGTLSRWRTRHIYLWVCGLLALTAARCLSQSLVNRSFELESFYNPPGTIAANGPITGWTATADAQVGLDSANKRVFADNGKLPDGLQVAFVRAAAGTTNFLKAKIEELLPQVRYRVTFQANARSAADSPTVHVWVDGTAILSQVIAPVAGLGDTAAPYRLVEAEFVAGGSSAELRIGASSAGSGVLLFDNVSVFPVKPAGWTTARWSDDASTGISSDSNWAYGFGTSRPVFIGDTIVSGIAGTNPAVSGRFRFGGMAGVVAGQFNRLTELADSGTASVVLGGSGLRGGAAAELTLDGLVPGNRYVVTFLGVGLEAAGGRKVTFASGSDALLVDENAFGQGEGIRVDYDFAASASTRRITLTPSVANAGFQLHGIALRDTGGVVTHAPLGREAGTVVLRGLARTKGLASTNWFEWGPTGEEPIRRTPAALAGYGHASEPVDVTLSGLVPGVMYRCRAVLGTPGGIARGEEILFRLGVTHLVTTGTDGAAGSLRDVMSKAVSLDTIRFSGDLAGRRLYLTQGELRVAGSVTLDASGFDAGVILDAMGQSRIFRVPSESALVLRRIHVVHGFLAGKAPSLESREALMDGGGGGILNWGWLEMTECTVAGNRVVGRAAADRSPDELMAASGDDAIGGGILSVGTMTLNRVSVIENEVVGGDGMAGRRFVSDAFIAPAPGGFVGGAGIASFGKLTLNQCTVANNRGKGGNGAPGGDFGPEAVAKGGLASGGGVYMIPFDIRATGSEIRQCTIAANECLPGSLAPTNAASASQIDSSFGAFSMINCVVTGPGTELVSGQLNQPGTNFIGTNAGLAPLGHYGGPTPTMPQQAGSPLIEAGDDRVLLPPYSFSTDQMGNSRRPGLHVSLGAVEAIRALASPVADLPSATVVGVDPFTGNRIVRLGLRVQVQWGTREAVFSYGLDGPGTLGKVAQVTVPVGVGPVPGAFEPNVFVDVPFSAGLALAWNVKVNSTQQGLTLFQPAFLVPSALPDSRVAGDQDGDGRVDGNEMLAVRRAFLGTSRVLALEEVEGLGTTRLVFGVDDGTTSEFRGQYSTDQNTWLDLGPVLRRYQIDDPDAGNGQPRFYRILQP